jgi:hypothetical protein
MATQGQRIDALESKIDDLAKTVGGRLDDIERVLKDGEALDELKAAILLLTERANKAGELADRVAKLEELATAPAVDDELITIESDGLDLRGDVLKAFRQIEVVANHINVRLPA